MCLHTGACVAQNLLRWTTNHVGIAINIADFDKDSCVRAGIDKMTTDKPDRADPNGVYVLHALFTGIKTWALERYVAGTTRKSGLMWCRQLEAEGDAEAFRRKFAADFDPLFE